MSLPALAPPDAARDRVIARLSEAFAADVLDVDTFESRVSQAHRADTVAALEALVADLPAPVQTALVPVAPVSVKVRSSGHAVQRKTLSAVFSGIQRQGPWSMPKCLRVNTVFAGAVLDFREADFAPGDTELEILAVFGGVEIIVPPGLSIEMDGTAIFGGFEHLERSLQESDPRRPRLVIRGTVVFGGVDITTRLPGETEKAARKRLKHEARRARQLAGRRAPDPAASGQDDAGSATGVESRPKSG
jgi:hypothetical protein